MMTTKEIETTVETAVTVSAPAVRAFEVFTAEMASWWPPEHHLVDGELDRMVVEPFVGGRIYDVATNGNECCWARVLAYDPPKTFVFSWDIALDWKVETDPEKASEVHVSFIPEGPEQTRVVLEHRELQRHGDGWQRMRDAVGSDGGWPVGLRAFAAATAA
jgi:uncharacterized protein YndB with AHSA1/START domain